MEALINNYTESEVIRPKTATTSYSQRRTEENTHGIVVSSLRREGINSRILNLLDSCRGLESNWDSEEAEAPEWTTIKKAEGLAVYFQNIGQKIYHAAPGPNGEIMLDLRNDDETKSLELILYSNKIVAVFIRDEELPTQELFVIEHMDNYLRWLNQR